MNKNIYTINSEKSRPVTSRTVEQTLPKPQSLWTVGKWLITVLLLLLAWVSLLRLEVNCSVPLWRSRRQNVYGVHPSVAWKDSPVSRRSPAVSCQYKLKQTIPFSPTVDLQASQKVSSVYLSMRLVLPTPREPIMMIWSLKSAGLGGIFLRRDWAPRAGDEFPEPLPPPAALRGMSYLGSISNSTFGITRKKTNAPKVLHDRKN